MTSSNPIFSTLTVPNDYSINSLGTSSKLLMPENRDRRWICIQNLSPVSIWINFGAAATVGFGSYELLGSGIGIFQQECNSFLGCAIYAIAESGTDNQVTAKDA